MSNVEVLERARARIADPARWTTKAVARDARGKWASPSSPQAARWCANGAVWAEAGGFGTEAWVDGLRALQVAAWELYGTEAHVVNDGPGGHAAALALYDFALGRARDFQNLAVSTPCGKAGNVEQGGTP